MVHSAAAGFWLADGPPGAGRELAGMGYNAVLRDFGRLGQLMLDGGRRDGRQVLPAGWVEQMSRMVPTGQPGRIRAGRFVGSAGRFSAWPSPP